MPEVDNGVGGRGGEMDRNPEIFLPLAPYKFCYIDTLANGLIWPPEWNFCP